MEKITQELINLISKTYNQQLIIKCNNSLDKLCRILDIEPESDNETDDPLSIIRDKLNSINYAVLDSDPSIVESCILYLDELYCDLLRG